MNVQLDVRLNVKDAKIDQKVFQEISRAVSGLPSNVNKVRVSLTDADRSASRFNKTLGQTESQMSGLSKAGRLFLQRMAQFAVLLPTFATLNRSIQGGARFLVDFQTQLAKIVRIDISGTANRLGEISQAAFEIGKSFGAGADQVVDTIRVFKQAGDTIEDSIEKARAATLAAQISTLSLVEAQEVLIAVNRQFAFEGLSSIEIIDKFAKVEDLAATNAQDLAESLRTGGNSFAEFGKSLDDTLGLVAALREQTRKTGREIGTFFKTLQTRLFAAGEARDAVERLGIQVENLDGSLRPTLDVLNDLKTAFDGLTEAEAASAAKAIAGVRQFESLQATLNSLARANELSAKTSDASGASFEKLAVQSQTLQFQLNQALAEFQELAIALGEAGVLDFFTEAVSVARLFAEGIREGVTAANELGISLQPLLALGAISVGKRIFGGGGGGNPIADAPLINTTRKGGTRQTDTGKGFVNTTKQTTVNLEALKNKAGIAAGVIAAMAASSLIAKDSLGGFGETISGAANSGLLFGSILGAKAGGIAAAASIIIDSFNKVQQALDDDRAARQELANISLTQSREASVLGRAGSDTDFQQSVIDSIINAFRANEGNIGDAFNQVFRSISNLDGVELSAEQVKNLALSSDVLLKSLTKLASGIDEGDDRFEEFQQIIELLKSSIENTERVGGNAGTILKEFGQKAAELTLKMDGLDRSSRGLIRTFKELAEVQDIKKQLGEIANLSFELKKLNLDPLANGILKLRIEADKAQANLIQVTNQVGQRLGQARSTGFEGISPDQSAKLIAAAFKKVDEVIRDGGKSIEQAGNELDREFGGDKLTRGIIEGLLKDLKTLREAQFEAGQASRAIEIEVIKQTVRANEELSQVQEEAADSIGQLKLSIAALGDQVDADSLRAISSLNLEDFNSILAGTSNFSEGITEAVRALAGSDVEKATSQLRAVSLTSQQELDNVNAKLAQVAAEFENLSNVEDQAVRQIQALNLQRKQEELQAQKQEIALRGAVDTARASLQLRKAEAAEAEKEADRLRKIAEARAEAEQAARDLEAALQSSTESFKDFAKEFRADLFDQEASARQRVLDAQADVISSSEQVAAAFADFQTAIFSFNDALAEATVESNLLGREISIISGGISSFNGRLNSLNNAFTDVLNDANISLEQRISLERQLAQETLQFLQQAQQEIVSAGLGVFGQSSGENRQLRQGVGGLEFIAQRLGGSFENFLNMSEMGFNELSNELLNLPVELRQNILNALRTLPSTANVGGFSVEQLEQAIGAIGAGVAPEEGLLSIEELTSLQVDQLEKLQELNGQQANLQLEQVQAALDQLAIAEEQLEISKILRERAEQDLGLVRDKIIEQNAILTEAQALQEQLTREVLAAENQTALEQIRSQATEFGKSRAEAKAIGERIVSSIDRLAQAQAAALEAASRFAQVQSAAGGFIPNFARGNVSPGEAAGLLRAAQREKRAMPAGSRLAVANTSEAIIPMRSQGFIPNFQNGSNVAAGIQAVRGINETVVAAITRSISESLSNINNQDATIAELRTIVSELQGVDTSVDEVVAAINSLGATINTVDTTDGGSTASTGGSDVNITLTTQQNGTITVNGLESLEDEIRSAVISVVESNVDSALSPVFEAIESIFQALRERGLISSFGQA